MSLTILSNGEDWEALYRDGKKVDEGHRLNLDDVLELLGHPVRRKAVPFDPDGNHFPDNLEDLR